LPRRENGLARSDIPVEPALIQVRIRKHNIALPIANILLPFLPIHWEIITTTRAIIYLVFLRLQRNLTP
jgi:hypothetical protein